MNHLCPPCHPSTPLRSLPANIITDRRNGHPRHSRACTTSRPPALPLPRQHKQSGAWPLRSRARGLSTTPVPICAIPASRLARWLGHHRNRCNYQRRLKNHIIRRRPAISGRAVRREDLLHIAESGLTWVMGPLRARHLLLDVTMIQMLFRIRSLLPVLPS